jgi:ribosomal protein RSM22 (predicted rRNA methylase)
VCGFSQRLQRPSFVRLTKHSGVGHEDIGYSYIVVRRGPRPSFADAKSGRIGEVGRWALAKEASLQVPLRELKVHDHHNEARFVGTESSLTNALSQSINPEVSNNEPQSRAELQEALRFEAFGWPRLVFPPLKRSGHVILDCCTAEGEMIPVACLRSD